MSANENGNAGIASQIRQQRKAKGWTQQQLADAAGLSLRMIQDAETGKRRPQPANLVDIRRALDIEGDATETREGWPRDVQVFLDVMGAFLSSMSESERDTTMRAITARIVGR